MDFFSSLVIRGQCDACGMSRNIWVSELANEAILCDHRDRGCLGSLTIVYQGPKADMPPELANPRCIYDAQPKQVAETVSSTPPTEPKSVSRTGSFVSHFETFQVGDRVVRRGQLAEVVKVDITMDPPSYIVRREGSGEEVNCESWTLRRWSAEEASDAGDIDPSIISGALDEDPGSTAVCLDEEGYKVQAARKDTEGMKKFIRRFLVMLGGEVSDEGGLSGLAPYYSGERAVQTIDRLQEELLIAKWVSWAPRLANGSSVFLQKLQNRPELNGECGTVITYEQGYYLVELDGMTEELPEGSTGQDTLGLPRVMVRRGNLGVAESSGDSWGWKMKALLVGGLGVAAVAAVAAGYAFGSAAEETNSGTQDFGSGQGYGQSPNPTIRQPTQMPNQPTLTRSPGYTSSQRTQIPNQPAARQMHMSHRSHAGQKRSSAAEQRLELIRKQLEAQDHLSRRCGKKYPTLFAGIQDARSRGVISQRQADHFQAVNRRANTAKRTNFGEKLR